MPCDLGVSDGRGAEVLVLCALAVWAATGLTPAQAAPASGRPPHRRRLTTHGKYFEKLGRSSDMLALTWRKAGRYAGGGGELSEVNALCF